MHVQYFSSHSESFLLSSRVAKELGITMNLSFSSEKDAKARDWCMKHGDCNLALVFRMGSVGMDPFCLALSSEMMEVDPK